MNIESKRRYSFLGKRAVGRERTPAQWTGPSGSSGKEEVDRKMLRQKNEDLVAAQSGAFSIFLSLNFSV